MIGKHDLCVVVPAVRLLALPHDVHKVLRGILVHALGVKPVTVSNFIRGKKAIPGPDLEPVPHRIIVGCPGA
jgi:hypothetical protein